MKLHHMAVVKCVPDLFKMGLLLSFSPSTPGIGSFILSKVHFAFVVLEKFSPNQREGEKRKIWLLEQSS